MATVRRQIDEIATVEREVTDRGKRDRLIRERRQLELDAIRLDGMLAEELD